jgi:hypothetical protein
MYHIYISTGGPFEPYMGPYFSEWQARHALHELETIEESIGGDRRYRVFED